MLWIREFYNYLKLALLDEYINKNIIKVNTVQVMEIDSLKKCILQLLQYFLVYKRYFLIPYQNTH